MNGSPIAGQDPQNRRQTAPITHHTRLSEADFQPHEANLKQSHPTYG
jgi:hypothetical protein